MTNYRKKNMKILNFYITRSFLATFLMAIAILTFGMTGANLMKVFDYLSRGIPVSTALEFLLYTIPMALAFTIPWASLVAIMLVFGRLSADNEITAMRACGISILQIVSPVIMTSFVLTCLCLYIQLQVGPKALGEARSLLKEVVVKHPTAALQPGIPADFGDLSIRYDSKDENDNIYDIQIFVLDKDGTIRNDVTASHGKITTDPEKQILTITLHYASLTGNDNPEDISRSIQIQGREVLIKLPYGREFNEREDVAPRDKYLTYKGIYARSILDKKRGEDTTRLEVELNQRIALSLAPIAFMMLGLPLAIRTSRRETSIGLFLSVALAAAYYGGVLVSDAIRNHAWLFPQYIVWIPPLLFQAFGAYYIIRIAKK